MADASLGLASYGEHRNSYLGADVGGSRNYSEEIAKSIDDFVRKTLHEQYVRAKGFLTKHRAKLDELAKLLLSEETMTVERFLEIFEGEKAKEREAKKKEKLDPGPEVDEEEEE
jgi:cell division protease FtsH